MGVLPLQAGISAMLRQGKEESTASKSTWEKVMIQVEIRCFCAPWIISRVMTGGEFGSKVSGRIKTLLTQEICPIIPQSGISRNHLDKADLIC